MTNEHHHRPGPDEQEPQKETIGRGELFFLTHPDTEATFSGYGLTMQDGEKAILVGVLMVDRPRLVDDDWLQQVESAFGEYELVPMTETGEHGIVCQMYIEPDSSSHLQQLSFDQTPAFREALQPLLEEPPRPAFRMRWDEEEHLWKSNILSPHLPEELKHIFEETGYGCLAVESDNGIVHVCHASDEDIEGFAGQPVHYQWQLIEMPTAPLIRLQITIFDQPQNPFRFESFLNVAEEDQAQVLDQLANQGQLHLAFYGDELAYQYTMDINHGPQQWQQLDELVTRANRYWQQLPPEQRDYDAAKAAFMWRFI